MSSKYVYSISKYETTIGQYAAFLNAVAKSNPARAQSLYNSSLREFRSISGVARVAKDGKDVYHVMHGGSSAYLPITFVDYLSADDYWTYPWRDPDVSYRPANYYGFDPSAGTETYAVTGRTRVDPNRTYLADARSYSDTPSYYGTVNQQGTSRNGPREMRFPDGPILVAVIGK